LLQKVGGVLYVNQSYNSACHHYVTLTPSNSLRKKRRDLFLSSGKSDWVGIYLPAGVSHHRAEGSAETKWYNMFKRANSFQESLLVTSSAHVQQTHLGAPGMGTVHGGGLEQKLGGDSGHESSCPQHGGKNRANYEACFKSSSFFAWVGFCQIVCSMIFPRGRCGGSWFLTLVFIAKLGPSPALKEEPAMNCMQ